MAPALRLPTPETMDDGRLLVRRVRGQAHQQRRRPQHAHGRHRTNKIVRAQVLRMARTTASSKNPHQRIHVVGGKGTRHEKT